MKRILSVILGSVALFAAIAAPIPAPAQNLGCTLLPSAVRTATSAVASNDIQNTYWRGANVVVNLSTYTSGTFSPTIQGKDPVSGVYYTILAGTGIATSVGSPFVMKVYPGLVATPNVANDVLPRVWRFSMLGTSTPSAAYSVSCSLLQ